MNGPFGRLFRLGAVAVAFGLLTSACSGGGGSSTSGVLPKAGTPAAHSLTGAIRSGMTRIANDEKSASTTGRHTMDFTQPSNTTTADPPVPVPNETPCTVTLFTNYIAGFPVTPNNGEFQYTPPAACPGPWAKVVLTADFSVDAGREFDRTGSIWIAGTNVYFGTTAEPSHNTGPTYHVERDITDLSAILQAPSTGELVLGNIVDSTFTSNIHVNSQIEFYPANATYPAPVVADNVYPLSGGPLGDNQYIHSQDEPLTGTFTLPKNVRAAYLDVFLQSQIGDEFWYTCFPNDLASQIPNCGNTAFREGDVAIDGQPAGVAPIYPWIYTGGIDPYLWRPIPGVETLNFKPYRVDLTPFAGVLSNGSPHTVTVNVFNNGNYFAANGALLVYLDHGSSQVTGGIISDATSLYPAPNVSENVKFNSQGIGSGPVNVTAMHGVSVDGYVNTSAGRIETKVQQQISFRNDQQIQANASESIFDQKIDQLTSITSTTTTHGPHGTSVVNQEKSWPLSLVYDFNVNPDGSAIQTTSVSQGKVERSTTTAPGQSAFLTFLSNTVTASDTLTFFAAGGDAPSNGKTTQVYKQNDSSGYCYGKTVAAVNYVLTQDSTTSCR